VTGVAATIPPNLSLCKSEHTHRPSSMVQPHIGQSMATTCCTSGWRGPKINVHYISVLQGNLLTPDKEEDGRAQGHLFLSFSFIFSLFHLFITNVTRALPLETIKWEAGATLERGTSQRWHTHLTETSRRRHTHLTKTTPHMQLPRRDLGYIPFLESL
jgi:hypothetical protein